MTVQRYFQDRAIKFDSLYDESKSLHFINKILRKGLFERVRVTVEEIQKLGKPTILDVGCGSGRNMVLFAEAGATEVHGIDFSQPMIDLAQAFAAKHEMQSVCSFQQADFMEYSFDRKFDMVVALGVFDYIEEPLATLRRMASLANRTVIGSFPEVSMFRAPFRKLRYSMRGCPVYFYTKRELEDLCKKTGFASYELRPMSSGYMLIGQVGNGAAPKSTSSPAKSTNGR